MRKTFWIIGLLLLAAFGTGLAACSKTQEQSADKNKALDGNKVLALKFLQGIQEGNKNKMYEASNLTSDMVNSSREKLIQSKQYKLTEQQRKDFEHVLRISGQIDFFFSKTRQMFPESSRIEITQSTDHGLLDDIRRIEHSVKITYANSKEAMLDKKGKPVKEMIVHLQQLTRSVGGSSVHGFTFSGTDFEKIADRDFEVLSYFGAAR